MALQHVFLQSNRGEEVHVPPPKNVASRIFRTLTFRGGRRNTNPNSRRNRGRNNKEHPISTSSTPRTPTVLDHTTTTNSSSTGSTGSHRYSDPTFIVEVNASISSIASSASTSFDTNSNTNKKNESTLLPTKATTSKSTGTSKHTTNSTSCSGSKHYEDIVVVHPSTTFIKETSLTVT